MTTHILQGQSGIDVHKRVNTRALHGSLPHRSSSHTSPPRSSALPHEVLQLWGIGAPTTTGPQHVGDDWLATLARRIDDQGLAPAAAVVPSHWGEVRKDAVSEILSQRRTGATPIVVVDLAEALLSLGRAPVAYCIVVEVEQHQTSVSYLDFDHRTISSVLTDRASAHDPELLTDIVLALSAELCDVDIHFNLPNPSADFCDFSSMEFIVAEGNGSPLVADLRRRGALAYPAPADDIADVVAQMAVNPPEEGCDVDCAEAFDSRAFDSPSSAVTTQFAARIFGSSHGSTTQPSESDSSPSASVAFSPPDGASTVERRVLAGIGIVALILGVVAAVGIFVAEPRPEATELAVGASPHSADRNRATQSAAPQITAPTHDSSPRPLPPIDAQVDAPADVPSNASTNAAQVPVHEVLLQGAGVRALFPAGWRVDSSIDGRLTAVSGGPMRILISAGDVGPSITLDDIAAGIRAHSQSDTTVRHVAETVVKDVEVVTHQEWPSDGAVVLWHHRIVMGKQVSVGCQFREPNIPTLRPTCDRAVETVGIA